MMCLVIVSRLFIVIWLCQLFVVLLLVMNGLMNIVVWMCLVRVGWKCSEMKIRQVMFISSDQNVLCIIGFQLLRWNSVCGCSYLMLNGLSCSYLVVWLIVGSSRVQIYIVNLVSRLIVMFVWLVLCQYSVVMIVGVNCVIVVKVSKLVVVRLVLLVIMWQQLQVSSISIMIVMWWMCSSSSERFWCCFRCSWWMCSSVGIIRLLLIMVESVMVVMIIMLVVVENLLRNVIRVML